MSNPKKQGKKIGQVFRFEEKGYQITKVAKNVQFFIFFRVPRVMGYKFWTTIKTWKQIECTNVGEIKKSKNVINWWMWAWATIS